MDLPTPRRDILKIGGLVSLVAALGCSGVNVRWHMNQGDRLYNAKQYEQAIQQYEGALEAGSDRWTASYRIAISYIQLYRGAGQGKNLEYAEAARRMLEQCMELEAPDEAARERARDYYVDALLILGDSRSAIAWIEEQLARNPTDVRLVLRLAGLYSKLGDFANTMHYLERRVELEPQSAEAWYSFALFCWDRSYRGGPAVSTAERARLVASGIAALERALEVRPEWPDALAYLNLLYRERAKVHVARGHREEAARDVLLADEFLRRTLALKGKRAS